MRILMNEAALTLHCGCQRHIPYDTYLGSSLGKLMDGSHPACRSKGPCSMPDARRQGSRTYTEPAIWQYLPVIFNPSRIATGKLKLAQPADASTHHYGTKNID